MVAMRVQVLEAMFGHSLLRGPSFAGGRHLFSGGSVVVDNPPAGRLASKQQSEQTRRRILRPVQPPTPNGERYIGREDRHLDFAELQNAHARPVAIAFLITVEHSLPAERNIAAGLEPRPVGSRVTYHEPAKVAGVPGADLRVEHGADLGFVVCSRC